MAEPSFETSGRGAVGGGGIKAASKAFLQASPNLACFVQAFPNKALVILWDFNGLQGQKTKRFRLQIFSSRPPHFSRILDAVAPVSAVARRRASGASPPAAGGVCDVRNGRVHGGGVFRIDGI
jgi:hypothetical protein